MKAFICTCLIILVSPRSFAATVGFLGDSLSTGAATHGELRLDYEELLQIFTKGEMVADAKAYGPRPPYLPQHAREYRSPWQWFESSLRKLIANRFLNSPQLSWAYLMGADLGVGVDRRFIAANNGARVADIPAQVERLLAATDGVIPEKVFVFFTGNDVCGLNADVLTPSREFGASLSKGIRHLFNRGQIASSEVEVYIVGFLGVMQLSVSPKILDKKIKAYGKTMTCRELRETPPGEPTENANLLALLVPHPGTYCPSAFGPEDRVRPIRGQITALISEFRTETKRQQGALQTWVQKEQLPVKFRYLDSTESLLFRAEDIAEDCFHLSAVGQQRLYETIKADIEAAE